MSNVAAYNRVHCLGLGVQIEHLKALQLDGAVGGLSGGTLIFCYVVKPTALSRSYKLELKYALGGVPEVRVLEPNLVDLCGDQGRPPHVYTDQHPVRLCLYLPSSGEWRRDLPLSLSVIPWSVEWLFFFEIWQATGDWLGGGIHPPSGKKKSKDQRQDARRRVR